MFSQQWNERKNDRKRQLEEDEGNMASSYSEHRVKRPMHTLPHRSSPKQQHNAASNFTYGHYTTQPAPPTITPADSDSEDTSALAEPRSFFSPFSTPGTPTPNNNDPPSPFVQGLDTLPSSQTTQMSDAPSFSDDFEMSDSVHPSPGGSFLDDLPPAISGRIPTPIHSSFAPSIRSEKASIYHDGDLADDEAIINRFRRGRRLPSPISEGEMSPSIIVEGLEEMQMEVETNYSEPERDTPTKKGHTRSKHSLRQWTGPSYGGDLAGGGVKRTFSMGYRADCEKCRMRVPGHFSHIITY